jgi:hypothetical protein
MPWLNILRDQIDVSSHNMVTKLLELHFYCQNVYKSIGKLFVEHYGTYIEQRDGNPQPTEKKWLKLGSCNANNSFWDILLSSERI